LIEKYELPAHIPFKKKELPAHTSWVAIQWDKQRCIIDSIVYIWICNDKNRFV
jgi:hypothetical protein